MRAISLVVFAVASQSVPAAADPGRKNLSPARLAAELHLPPPSPVQAAVETPLPRRDDKKKPATDLFSALRHFGRQMAAWQADPVATALALQLGDDTIAVLRLHFR